MHLPELLLPLFFVLSVQVSHSSALVPGDLFHYPQQTFCFSGGCLDLQDDGVLIITTDPFPFYGRLSPRTVIASINGIVSLGSSVTLFRDISLSESLTNGAISVFYHDTDLTGAGMMYHEVTNNQISFQRANDLIRRGFIDATDFEAKKIIVTTYLGVGYFSKKQDLLNTYQSVIVTDYQRTFLILLYVDVQWLRADNFQRYAQAGIYAGDGRVYYELPYSGTTNLTMLEQFTNMNTPGLSLYQISGRKVEPGGCSMTDSYPIKIYPHFGSELGGNVVRLQGHCFSSQDNIEAEFGSSRVSCVYMSALVAVCVTPPMSNPRTLTVNLLVNGEAKGQTSYTTLSSDSSYGIELEGSFQSTSPSPLLLTVSELVVLTYNSSNVFPGENPGSFTVDALLYAMNLVTGEWEKLATLKEDVANSGTLSARLPAQLATDDILPIAVFVGTSLSMASGQSLTLQAVRSSNLRVGIFTPVYYFADRALLNSTGRSSCYEWYNTSSSSISADSVQCPSILDQASLPTSGFEQVNMTSVMGMQAYGAQWLTTFHSGAHICYRQTLILDHSAATAPTQQECCYNNQGQLQAGSPSGGAVSEVAAEYDGRRHFLEDVRPYLLCCVNEFPSCDLYYQRRPSSRGEGHQPKRPAWIVGDPHFITFDGMRYTFNGFGEFTLLRTDSDQFTIQGRMVPFPDNRSGSILSSLAVKYGQDRINIVTNEVGENRGGMDVYLNDTRITPDYLPKMYFQTFMLSYNTSTVLRIAFLNGVQLECQTSNGNITQFFMGVPNSLRGKVSGLLGMYNKCLGRSVSSHAVWFFGGPSEHNADIETVHSTFGLSCTEEIVVTLREDLVTDSKHWLEGFVRCSDKGLISKILKQTVG